MCRRRVVGLVTAVGRWQAQIPTITSLPFDAHFELVHAQPAAGNNPGGDVEAHAVFGTGDETPIQSAIVNGLSPFVRKRLDVLFHDLLADDHVPVRTAKPRLGKPSVGHMHVESRVAV